MPTGGRTTRVLDGERVDRHARELRHAVQRDARPVLEHRNRVLVEPEAVAGDREVTERAGVRFLRTRADSCGRSSDGRRQQCGSTKHS